MISIAIIITLYNREHSIVAALESALAQDYSNKEIIVVDDGSTDSSVERLSPYLDKITLIKQDNSGPGAAKNTGVMHANSEYFIFLDSDDVLPNSNTLSIIVERIQKGYDFVSFKKITKLKNNGEKIETFKTPLDMQEYILSSPLNYPGLPPYCFKKKYYQLSGGMACQPWGDAINFWRVYFDHVNKPYIINDIGYYYDLTGSDNVSKGKSSKNSSNKYIHIINTIYEAYLTNKDKMTEKQRSIWLLFLLGYSFKAKKQTSLFYSELIKSSPKNILSAFKYISDTKVIPIIKSKLQNVITLLKYKIERVTNLCSCIFASLACKKINLNNNSIIINSTSNNNFNFNSKFFFEYLQSFNHDFDVYFIINDDLKRNELNSLYPGRFISNKKKTDIDTIKLSKIWICSTVDMPLPYSFKHKDRIVYHLGHGIPLKNIGFGETEISIVRKVNRYLCMKNITHSVCYSDNFKLPMQKMFGPLNPEFVSLGQPRNDSLTLDRQNKLSDFYPSNLKVEKTILYSPTWRSYDQTKFFPFNDFNGKALNDFLEDNKYLMIVREHPYYKASMPEEINKIDRVIKLNSDVIPDFTPYLIDIDVLITDYSSIYFDIIGSDKTNFVFIPYDIERYSEKTGFSINYNELTPGPKVDSMKSLLSAIVEPDDYSEQKQALIELFNIKYHNNCKDHYERIVSLSKN